MVHPASFGHRQSVTENPSGVRYNSTNFQRHTKEIADWYWQPESSVRTETGSPSNEHTITLAPRERHLLHILYASLYRSRICGTGARIPIFIKAIVELRSADRVVDSVEQPLGLRFYSIDPNLGFILNGRPYHLHGVDRHQDYMNKGWAISEVDMEKDISLLKELGATVVRCAHYQHSDYFYTLCDQAGILVWAEIPQVNLIRNTPEFEATSRNQLLDLIRQNVNHPAIFAWSLFNEIGGKSDDPHRELQDLKPALAHGEDPTRPTIEATMTRCASADEQDFRPAGLRTYILAGIAAQKKIMVAFSIRAGIQASTEGFA